MGYTWLQHATIISLTPCGTFDRSIFVENMCQILWLIMWINANFAWWWNVIFLAKIQWAWLFWAQILRAFAANTVGVQACCLYKMRTSGHSLGSDFLQFLIKLILRSHRCLNLRTHCYCLQKERVHKIATYIQRLQAKQRRSSCFTLRKA